MGALWNASDIVHGIDYFTGWQNKLKQQYYDAGKSNKGALDESTLNCAMGGSNYVSTPNASDVNGSPFYGAPNPNLRDYAAQPHDIAWDNLGMTANAGKFLTSYRSIGVDWQLAGRSLYLGLNNLNSAQGWQSLTLGLVTTAAFAPKTVAIPLALYYLYDKTK